jgi:hypothetical protein
MIFLVMLLALYKRPIVADMPLYQRRQWANDFEL